MTCFRTQTVLRVYTSSYVGFQTLYGEVCRGVRSLQQGLSLDLFAVAKQMYLA